jgi:HEAT repeat protein
MAGSPSSAAQPQPSRTPPSFDELIQTIRTGNAYQRAEAIAPLSWIDDPRVVPELITLLKDEDATTRSYTARELARLADKRSADALAEALTDTMGDVRRYAAEGLAKVGDERHVPALVASVMAHLPDANTGGSHVWYSFPAMEAIGKLSSKAPPELIRLIERIPGSGNSKAEVWWRLHENTARCLGRIGDKEAFEPLRRAQAALERGCQDYRTWYAVRKALAAIGSADIAFDRPAADILNEVSGGKGGMSGMVPLTKLGDLAMEDLAWVLRFENSQDDQRVRDAIRALGEIGSNAASQILRDYVDELVSRLSTQPRTPGQLIHFYLPVALESLLKTAPNEETVSRIFVESHRLREVEQYWLIAGVLDTSSNKVPAEIKMVLAEWVMLGSGQAGPLQGNAAEYSARWLGGTGGQRAGEILSKALVESSETVKVIATAEALRAIRDYDAVPALIEASKITNVPKDAVAYAMGSIRDERAIPALRDMIHRDGLTQQDRLWAAAALERMGADYDANARLIREALPDSLDQAKSLHDKETITAIAAFIKGDDPQAKGVERTPYRRRSRFPDMPSGPSSLNEHAISTLVAIRTNDALEALAARVDLDKIDDPDHVRRVSTAAAQIAESLGHPAKERWVTVSWIAEAVARSVSFTLRISQQSQFRVETDEVRPDDLRIIEKDHALAQKMWIGEISRRLHNAATNAPWAHPSDVHGHAVRLAELIFAPELIPSLERLARECKTSEDFRGKRGVVRYYNVRSMAAKVLTEKTGRPYTFVDADGRTHPGGWNPSQDE